MSRPVFMLYRPWAPAVRAQSVQVICAAHALARRRAVTACFRPTRPTTPANVLVHLGLAPAPGLALVGLPRAGTPSALVFRAAFATWWLQNRDGIGLARTLRYARAAQRVGCPVVVEVHGLHDDVGLERQVLAQAHGLVTNSEGTLALLRRRHGVLPPARVVPNATRGPGPPLAGTGRGIGYVGSIRKGKGLAVLARLAEVVEEPVVVITPEVGAARALGRALDVRPAVPPHRVPSELAALRVLVLPLAHGRFGDHETCPLKLYDYLASGRPVVVADTPAIRALVPSWVPRFVPDDLASLQRAVAQASEPQRVARFAARPLVRTWSQRADEIDEALSEWLP